MSRAVGGVSLAALLAQEAGEAFVPLLTIEHATLEAPIRVAGDAVNVVSRGDTYIAFPFDLRLPDDVEDRPKSARLTIDNVDRQIVIAVRTIQSPAEVRIEIVRASEPDAVEASWSGLLLRNVRYDALTVTGELVVDDLSTEPWPAARFVPSAFPGLF